ncbi:MAG: nucleotidyltransferase family protein [bacterium]|nr:nucleotidyltransferase family protein [bacterium]
MKAVVLAAGVGSRLGELTRQTPKCLLPIAGRPALDYWCEMLARAGVTDAYINTHHHADPGRAFVALRPHGLRFVEGFEPTLLGSAGTLRNAQSFVADEEQFYIIYADNFAEMDLLRLRTFHRKCGFPPLVVAAYRTDQPERCGIFELDEWGKVIDFEEKPNRPKTTIANSGIHVASPELFTYVPDSSPADIGFHVLPQLTGKMYAYVTDEYIQDIGTPETYAAVCARQMKSK